MKLVVDDEGITHMPGNCGSYATICGWNGENDEADFGWPEIKGPSPSCQDCRETIKLVANCGMTLKAMREL